MTVGLNNLQLQKTMESALAQEAMEKESLGESAEGSSCSYSSWDDSDDESLIEEMEERIEEFSHVGSTPALAALVFNTDDYRLALPRKRFPKSSSDSLDNSAHKSIISEILFTKDEESSLKSFQMRRSNSDQFVQKGSFTNLLINHSAPVANQQVGTNTQETKPFTVLKDILKQEGISYPSVSEEATNALFVEMKEENYAAYSRQIADAARKGDVEVVRSHIESGKTLQCCNKFQESLLHVVCRRGHEDVLRIMLEETHVSVCVQDDLGRTPLHELCWTSTPNFSMVEMILQKSPDLLYVKDKRHFTPLHYVGQTNWDSWCEFLEANRELVAPRTL